MNKKRRIGWMLIALGIFALFLAAIIVWHNHLEGEAAVEQSNNVLIEMKAQQNSDARVAVVEGHAYLGALFFPSLNLKVPVMADISDEKLLTAPCKQAGSIQAGGLVIAGHNFVNQFGRLDRLCVGENIFLTDMRGEVTHYLVQEIELIGGGEAKKMLDPSWDMTLYTCDYSGNQRLTLRCMRVE